MTDQSVKFVRTLRNNPYIGAFVKDLLFCEPFIRGKDTYDVLDIILRSCPNVEFLSSLDAITDEMLWPYILQSDIQLKKLQYFGITADAYGEWSDMWSPFVALKYCKTIRQVSISFDSNIDDRVDTCRHELLWKNLSKFTSMHTLLIRNDRSFSQSLFNLVLQNSPPKLQMLSMKVYNFSAADQPLKSIMPASNLKSLEIREGAYFDIPSLQYFAHTFTALTTAHIGFFEYPHEDEELWWSHFMPICMRLDHLSFGINYSSPDQQHQVKQIIELGLASAKEGAVKKELFLDLRGPSSGVSICCSKSPEKIKLRFVLTDINDARVNWIIPFAPDETTIAEVVFFDEYMTVMIGLPGDDMDPAKVSYRRISNQKCVDVFAKVIGHFGQKDYAKLTFSDMVLWDLSSLSNEALGQSASKLQLEFQRSALTEGIFPEISSRLVELDKLLINACDIYMEEAYTLKIFLPSTKIRSFGLVVAASHHMQRTGEFYNEAYALFIAAFDSASRYTVKIETRSDTYVIERDENGSKRSTKSGVRAHGTEDNRLIWIKCLELKEFMVSGRADDRFEVLE
ncbi:hypothetical protein HMPREF1544_00213 [Mucor circinelloides 1006PhL]|uniref:F-box domain-containing protein n=1 Tax=Mucor circinelloides f. circinelloides (strain 1006PhL) TaxID=1220926 RepID=S2JS17_MUCC1|nr:hypothetical protein HMPREF1544_00213 [Mucor circinelloides 1006PhL]